MAKQVEFRVGEDEVVLADVNAPLTALVFPLLELIVITGVCWIVIGRLDVTPGVGLAVRNLVSVLWMALLAWRFALPVWRTRRRRFLVTDRRILARGRTGKIDSIPHSQIHSVRRAEGGLDLGVYGFNRPIHFELIGKARQVEKVINGQLSGAIRR